MADETKKCPYCGEEILKEAKKCKHCGEWLEEKEENISIQQIIENYINSNILDTDCITVSPNLTDEKIKESGLVYDNEEKPLLLLYKKSLFYDLKTRILITDRKIYYKALPDSFWTGITANFVKKIEGSFELQNVNQLSIAEHDHCIGTAYVGHQLMINNTVVGLIRMGTGVEFDEKAITYLNRLFEQIVNSKEKQSTKNTSASLENIDSESKPQNNSTNSNWSNAWQLCLAIIGILICINFFPHLFDDKIILTNPLTGEKIEIPVVTTYLGGGEKEYCIYLSIFHEDERYFCSKDAEALSEFASQVKQRERQVEFSGQIMPKGTASFYGVDSMIYEPLKLITGVYEKNPKAEQEDAKLTKAIEKYHKEQIKEKAKEFGVSKKCAEAYLQSKNSIKDEISACSSKENTSIKNYLKKEEEEFNNREYALDDVELRYGNAGMPKSLVLQGVSIMCFEKANIGDNSKCSNLELNTINKFFRENKNINWSKEYFDYNEIFHEAEPASEDLNFQTTAQKEGSVQQKPTPQKVQLQPVVQHTTKTTPTHINTGVPQPKPVKTQQNNQDIDDFMN